MSGNRLGGDGPGAPSDILGSSDDVLVGDNQSTILADGPADSGGSTNFGDGNFITDDGSIGTQAGMLRRLLTLLPPWFEQGQPPILSAILSGYASVLASVYQLLQYARVQTRIATAYGGWLDLVAYDYFGFSVQRQSTQIDQVFRATIDANLLPVKGTRQALINALTTLTGRTPIVWYPWNPSDVGGYNEGNLGYNTTGCYGSQAMPGQLFLTAYRPNSVNYSTTDAQIYATIAAVIPAGTTAWTIISN